MGRPGGAGPLIYIWDPRNISKTITVRKLKLKIGLQFYVDVVKYSFWVQNFR